MKKNNLLALAKLTSKGQVTVPKSIRAKLNLNEGDFVVFCEDENKDFKILKKDNCKVVSNNNNKQIVADNGDKNE